jgi:hypothetical protein
MDDAARDGPAVSDGHVQGIDDQGRVLAAVDRSPNDSAAEGVHHGAAVDLALPRRMLGDVRDPELVRRQTVEFPVHEVIAGGDAPQAFDLGRPGKAGNPGQAHQLRDQMLADAHVHTPGQFGTDPAGPVRAAAGRMDFPDEPGQPLPAHPCR